MGRGRPSLEEPALRHCAARLYRATARRRSTLTHREGLECPAALEIYFAEVMLRHGREDVTPPPPSQGLYEGHDAAVRRSFMRRRRSRSPG